MKKRSTRLTADRQPLLGLDIGGVIVSKATRNSDTSFFGDRPMDTPPVPGAVAAISAMAAGRFAGRIHLVSKAGPKIEAITRAWLAHTGFLELTGIGPDQVHFVRERADKEPVCRRLGVTHFVDDTESVLNHLKSVQYRYLFLDGQVDRATPADRTLILVPDWPTLRQQLDRHW